MPDAPDPATDAESPAAVTSLSAGRRWTAMLMRPVSAVAGVVALIAVFPSLAPLLAWPLLLGLPTWFLVARAVPGLSPAGRLGVAVVAGVEISAHLSYLMGLAFGYGLPSVSVTVGILGLATWVLATQPVRPLAPPTRLSAMSVIAAIRAQRGALALSAVAFGVVGGLLQLSAWHRTGHGWVSGGWNWSDFLVHVGIAQSIAHGGNFPPQVPYFAGASLTYHWFGDFHAAILATTAQIDVIPALILSNALLAGALALVVYELAMVLMAERRAALLAVGLVLFGGGLGFVRLFIDLHDNRGSLLGLVSTTSYDNNFLSAWPYFRIASVFGTGLLDQRATAYGLPIAIAVVLVVQLCWGRHTAGIALAGFMAALECPFQFFFFPATYLILAILLLARRAWRDPQPWGQVQFLLAPAIYGLTFIVAPVLQQRAAGTVHLVAGWPDAPWHDGLPAVAFFYLTNLGIPFMLALVAVARRRTPHRRLLAGWMAGLFIVPNLIVVSAITFDANKFFQLMWIPVALLAGWLIRTWPRPAIAGVLAVSLGSVGLTAVWHLRDDRAALSLDQEAAARWIEDRTPERSVFVTDAFLNSPVDLAGRLRLTSFDPFVAGLGYDPTSREADVHMVYCDGPERAAAVMRRDSATYVLSSGGVIDCSAGKPTDFDHTSLFETTYRSGGVTVWRLRDATSG